MQNRLDTDLWQTAYGPKNYVSSKTVYASTTGSRPSLADVCDADLVMEMIGRGYAVMKLDDIAEKVK